jgi:flagellin
MAMNSVNTNMGAMVALQSLNKTSDAMDATQKRISTGFRVADAKDDGAAFAVAQKVRGDVAAVTSANEQLGGAKGLLDTSMAGLAKISDALKDIKTALIKLSDDKIVGTERTNYESQYNSLVQQIGQYVNDSSYNGATLLGVSANADGATAAGGTTLNLVRNEAGETYQITGQASGAFDLSMANEVGIAATATAAEWKAHLESATAAAGDSGFAAVEANVNAALNAYGNNSKAVDSLISFNKDKIDALESGLGALVDADLAKESAKLQSLQIRQQLGTQALSMANQAPQSLLSLFR